MNVKMISIEVPEDLISIAFYNILSSRADDEEFYNFAHDWNKKVIFFLKPFYPITVIIEGDEIKFQIGEVESADMKVTIELQTMLDLAYGRENPFFAIENGLMEIEGLGNDSINLVKFYNIFMVSMQKVAKEQSLNYFELEKKTR